MNNKIVVIISSIIIGFICAIMSLQYNPIIRERAETLIKQVFEHSFDCAVANARLSNINLFGMDFIAHDITVQAANAQDWRWSAQKINIHIGWLDLFKTRRAKLELMLQGLHAYSKVEQGNLLIRDHLMRMIAGSQDSPVDLKTLIIRKGVCQIDDAAHAAHLTFDCAAEIRNNNQNAKFRVYLMNGQLNVADKQIINIPLIKVRFEQVQNNTNAAVQGTFIGDQLPPEQKEYLIQCNWQNARGTIDLHTKDKTYGIQGSLAQDATGLHGDIAGNLPLALVNQLYTWDDHKFTGHAQVKLHLAYDTQLQLTGSINTENAGLLGIPLGTVTVAFNRCDKLWQGDINWNHSAIGPFGGSWQYNEKDNVGTLQVTNQDNLEFINSYWKLHHGDCALEARLQNGQFLANYHIHALHAKLNELAVVQGHLSTNADTLTCNGVYNEQPYAATFTLPNLHLSHAVVHDAQRNPIITITATNKTEWHAMLYLARMQKILQALIHEQLYCDGIMQCNARAQDGTLVLQLTLNDGIIHHLPTYNFINACNARVIIDRRNLTIALDDAKIQFRKGTIAIKNGIAQWDKENQRPFLHVPILVNKILLNHEKDMFALLSGALLCQYHNEAIELLGKLWLDKGQINKNILSISLLRTLLKKTVVEQSTLSELIKFNVNVESKKPFHIKTSFLDTEAYFSGNVKGTISDPKIAGSLWLDNGTLAFPYRPLYITTAKLYFSTADTFDPAFELVAKGAVKKYNVVLRSSGSLSHPHINFESTPPLQEEQIISLLLSGCDKESIMLIMPTLIMQNMQTIIFGPEQSDLKLASYFQRLLSPLSNIRIVPSFSDQTGRGGLRWALEIDLNDRLQAMIQKNFSQPEDTQFEVEYALSNDIVLRGIKDEHSDLGGEVELRWKF